MREAALEREWQATALSYRHQAGAARSDNPDGARALLFATMGYRPPYPDSWDTVQSIGPGADDSAQAFRSRPPCEPLCRLQVWVRGLGWHR